jgi:RHS repeat-associated protein
MNKVMSISENGNVSATYDYHVDGQVAKRLGADGKAQNFFWDGLALIRRGETNLTNEPYVTGGNPIIANGATLFNDILGTTQGATDGKEFSKISRDSFGETLDNSTDTNYDYFTGKPKVEGLGYAFLFRNYAAGLGKWTTSDPLGYPDGWNNFAYVNNKVTVYIDFLGASGTLVIYSSSAGDASSLNTSGHSWISYTDDATKITTTYGTWGNNPNGLGNGLHENLEAGRSANATRSAKLNDAQATALMNKIQAYKDMGESAWGYTDPCTDFAIDAWQTGTEEDLGSWWIWDTPSELVNSITQANGGNANGTYTPGGGSSIPE